MVKRCEKQKKSFTREALFVIGGYAWMMSRVFFFHESWSLSWDLCGEVVKKTHNLEKVVILMDFCGKDDNAVDQRFLRFQEE